MAFLCTIAPTPSEIACPLPGDELIAQPDVVMTRAFTLPGRPELVWPWFRQLGKNRAGWYFPRWFERFVPAARRGLWRLEPSLQTLAVGARMDDWGKDGYLELASMQAPSVLVYKSARGRLNMSWAITLQPKGDDTRVVVRLCLAPVRHRRLALLFGGFFDALTIAGLAAGLRERLSQTTRARRGA